MFRLDNNLLIELGLGQLPPDEKDNMLKHIYETLEMRVGMKLAQQMTNAQLDEFEKFIDSNDERGALAWLETNFPDYKKVVGAELETLKAEIRQVAPQILASSAANQANGGGQPVAQPIAPPQDPQTAKAPQIQQPQQPPAQSIGDSPSINPGF